MKEKKGTSQQDEEHSWIIKKTQLVIVCLAAILKLDAFLQVQNENAKFL